MVLRGTRSPALSQMSNAPLNNYVTQSRSRVKGSKNTPLVEFRRLLAAAKERLSVSGSRSLKADINGVVVELITNSRHQAEFWSLNWSEADAKAPVSASIYSAVGVEGIEPSAYYCPELRSALFANTEYYGQC